MVARRCRHDVGTRFELSDVVVRPPDLERSGALALFFLAPHIGAGGANEGIELRQRGTTDDTRDAGLGLPDISMLTSSWDPDDGSRNERGAGSGTSCRCDDTAKRPFAHLCDVAAHRSRRGSCVLGGGCDRPTTPDPLGDAGRADEREQGRHSPLCPFAA